MTTWICYLGGWLLYRTKKWLGWTYARTRASEPAHPAEYVRRYWPVIAGDLITQIVIGLAWVTGMLDALLDATFAAGGMTRPVESDPRLGAAFAALVGYIVASVLSEVLVKRLQAPPPAAGASNGG